MRVLNYDYSKLRGKIREVLGNESNYSKKLNISASSTSAKLNGHIPFSQEEITSSIKILGINESEIHDYFFTSKVENNSTKNN